MKNVSLEIEEPPSDLHTSQAKIWLLCSGMSSHRGYEVTKNYDLWVSDPSR